ncbi:Gfo/Idh/MocA family oxidoreductase [Mesorhizobium waimense]|uniref:Gfo/Idh/MocA family oxidoreductase n=1 Tax=Mesorhizobium waimense TaxID=1300307 RepID=UPI003CCB67CF
MEAGTSGKHVLCEKPVGIIVEEVDALENAVAVSGRVLQVGGTRARPAINEAIVM